MANLLSKLLSIGEEKRLKSYMKAVTAINDLEDSMKSKSDDELRRLSDDLRVRAQSGEALSKILPEAFALVREASSRTTGLRHYDVQLIGAMALNDGCIAEMKTGEGKTLVSTAAGFLNALTGENVHVVTVNDYLAKRDSEWMGRVYNALGMRTGLIQNGMFPIFRKPAYEAEVTYGTNSEFGFDYLRDNTVSDVSGRVQRGHNFAIVDEVDSILIDEARTPLIISGIGESASDTYKVFADVVCRLNPDEDLSIDEKRHTVYATEEGLDKIEEMLGMEIYADVTGVLSNHLKQSLAAEYLFKRDINYVVVQGEVKIVDEFTGRIMEGRRFSEGLHQAIEAKEHVEIKDETKTLATVTLQNYFRLYKKLSGMTGTALTEEGEFKQIYGLPVVPIPTNKPVVRKDQPDYIFRTEEGKFKAVVEEIEQRHRKNQPVLVGTASIESSERLSRLLEKRGVDHKVLNAKNPESEAAIVAQAGRLGAVTIATNMAGRGTDILLGGNHDALFDMALAKFGADRETAQDWQINAAKAEADYITERESYAVRLLGGLYVIGTERHESRRIDNQLRGRSGRQGDDGESRFFLSLDDKLLRLFGAERLDAVSEMMKKRGMEDDEPLEDELVSKVITTAQQQVESMHFSARKNVLEYDDVMDLQRKAIYQERNSILEGKDIEGHISEYAESTVYEMLEQTCPFGSTADEWDYEAIDSWVESMCGEPFDSKAINTDEEVETIGETILEAFSSIIDMKREKVTADIFNEVCQQIMLNVMDTYWIAHLTEMDHLKTGIGLRAIGQRDPLVEYKEEAYNAFGNLIVSIYEEFLRIILRLPVPEESADTTSEADSVWVADSNPFDPDKMIYSSPDESSINEQGLDRPI